MALQILPSLVVVCFGFLASMVEPRRPYGSSPVTVSGKGSSDQSPPLVGLCSSAVVVHGYKCQEFEVRTEDDYILSMQRIPEGRAGGGGSRKQPVLLQHGILVDGMTWLMNSPDQSLAFILADSGFDVWIANTRGTRFSRKHTTLEPADREYWNWSWDELAAYDFPAAINFVYHQTGQKIDYVGHSLGTLVALASLSLGNMLDKLKSVALICPVAYLSHIRTGIVQLAARGFVSEIVKSLGIAEFNLNDHAVKNILKLLCANPGVNCYDLLTFFTGKNCCLNASTVDLVLKNEPQPTSTKNMVHLAQTVRDGFLSKYDYGNVILNLKHYGQRQPPLYDLTNIPNNISLFISHGGEDALADTKDVLLLLDSLKFHDEDKLTVQFIKSYAHIDFVMGVTAKEVVYDPLVSFFKKQ